MSDTLKVVALVGAFVLLAPRCANDPTSAAKVAGTGAAVGVGVGAGAVAAGAAKGAISGVEQRARDRVRARPNGPARPTPSTTIPPTVAGPVAVQP